MADDVLLLDRVTAGYNRVPAITDVSFAVAPGEVVTLLGPNGAGKTTTLLTIAGLVTPLQGTVTALGARVHDTRTHLMARRGLHLVPDDRGLFPGMTVADHLRLAQTRPDRGRLRLVFDRFPVLERVQGRKVGLLSGGEQQMLTIGMAVLTRPQILMIDEMSLGLAPKVVQEIAPVLRDLAREEQIAMILVEQHVDLALRVSDRGIVLNQGRVVLSGTAHELLANRERLEAAYFADAADVGAADVDAADVDAADRVAGATT
jgi:branched-chain amino acid transport system ATP-binding protein